MENVKQSGFATECRKLLNLVKRNAKCYFKDKVLFLMSLITPIILLVLFATFLRNVYIDSFKSISEQFGVPIEGRVLNGITGAWLLSSILGVSSVTVAFCSNTIMIDDKISGVVTDFQVTPLKPVTRSVAYFVSNFFVTSLIMFIVMLIGHIYLAAVGWFIPVSDVFLIIVDVIICTLFGTLLAGVCESFIKTQGGLSAVSTLVSSMYGFICGAYMPLSQFAEGLRNILCCLPGTYSISIIRTHYMGGYVEEICKDIANPEVADAMRKALLNGFDAKIEAFGNAVPLGAAYGIVLGACAVIAAAFVAVVILQNTKRKGKK